MKKLEEIHRRISPVRRALSDDLQKASLSLAGAFALNGLYAAWEIGCGIYYHSYWFITLGAYYALLTLTRWMLLQPPRGKRQSVRALWMRYRACGAALLLLNLIPAGMIALAVLEGQGARYAGYLIYAVAAYTFYRVGMAIRNLVKLRRFRNPRLTAAKIISLAAAIISMLSLEIAMLRQFGGDEAFFRTMTAWTGAGACAIVTWLAGSMIVTAQKNLKRL
ncbi:MAG: hypothetical protein LUJ09_05500 [Firmicutes bacterium]|nr:hypothetical protein [Bacillota bacterium]